MSHLSDPVKPFLAEHWPKSDWQFQFAQRKTVRRMGKDVQFRMRTFGFECSMQAPGILYRHDEVIRGIDQKGWRRIVDEMRVGLHSIVQCLLLRRRQRWLVRNDSPAHRIGGNRSIADDQKVRPPIVLGISRLWRDPVVRIAGHQTSGEMASRREAQNTNAVWIYS